MAEETFLYYTYYSYEEFGRGYIGYRRCPAGETPESDKYMGSFKDKTFKPTSKIILTIHKSREEAIMAEIKIQKFFDVVDNPHFANRALQTSKGFHYSRLGEKHTKESKRKMSQKHTGKILSEEHRKNLSLSSFCSEERRRQLSEKMSGKNNPMYGKSGELAPSYGKHHTEESKIKISRAVSKTAGLCHPNHGDTSQMSATEIIKNFPDMNLSQGHLSDVANGKRTHHKEWRKCSRKQYER
jgi:hypothetical protein